ncbi:MAG: uncharacterized protein KVP18_004856 [Porospora cf. gigantea A]|uniref:uncharacterized protein n=1 Tax=Porospora cf. gigantea A TaxID=2853593 RepID=UPI003559921C|nr:MAG: hypothetical protein KVP18_004856 [Porospora cf. gigantea A]
MARDAFPYQLAIRDLCMEDNLLVVLPTNAGKTFCASLVVREYLADPTYAHKICVFLAPTTLLTQQQGAKVTEDLTEHLGMEAVEHRVFTSEESEMDPYLSVDWRIPSTWAELFTGLAESASEAPATKTVKRKLLSFFHTDEDETEGTEEEADTIQSLYPRLFFLTPERFLNYLVNGMLTMANISLLVIDEAHHAIGEGHSVCKVILEDYYSRTKLVEAVKPEMIEALRERGPEALSELSTKLPRLMGLTASPFKDSIRSICRDTRHHVLQRLRQMCSLFDSSVIVKGVAETHQQVVERTAIYVQFKHAVFWLHVLNRFVFKPLLVLLEHRLEDNFQNQSEAYNALVEALNAQLAAHVAPQPNSAFSWGRNGAADSLAVAARFASKHAELLGGFRQAIHGCRDGVWLAKQKLMSRNHVELCEATMINFGMVGFLGLVSIMLSDVIHQRKELRRMQIIRDEDLTPVSSTSATVLERTAGLTLVVLLVHDLLTDVPRVRELWVQTRSLDSGDAGRLMISDKLHVLMRTLKAFPCTDYRVPAPVEPVPPAEPEAHPSPDTSPLVFRERQDFGGQESNSEASSLYPDEASDAELPVFRSEETHGQAQASVWDTGLHYMLLMTRQDEPLVWWEDRLQAARLAPYAISGSCRIKSLIFCRTRRSAQLLSFLLTAHRVLKSDWVVAGNDLPRRGRWDIMTRFRLPTASAIGIHCLVATSVAEEGIDVPDCNLVIRFDGVSTLKEHIQSRGRARMPDSHYVIMAARDSNEASLLPLFGFAERNLVFAGQRMASLDAGKNKAFERLKEAVYSQDALSNRNRLALRTPATYLPMNYAWPTFLRVLSLLLRSRQSLDDPVGEQALTEHVTLSSRPLMEISEDAMELRVVPPLIGYRRAKLGDASGLVLDPVYLQLNQYNIRKRAKKNYLAFFAMDQLYKGQVLNDHLLPPMADRMAPYRRAACRIRGGQDLPLVRRFLPLFMSNDPNQWERWSQLPPLSALSDVRMPRVSRCSMPRPGCRWRSVRPRGNSDGLLTPTELCMHKQEFIVSRWDSDVLLSGGLLGLWRPFYSADGKPPTVVLNILRLMADRDHEMAQAVLQYPIDGSHVDETQREIRLREFESWRQAMVVAEYLLSCKESDLHQVVEGVASSMLNRITDAAQDVELCSSMPNKATIEKHLIYCLNTVRQLTAHPFTVVQPLCLLFPGSLEVPLRRMGQSGQASAKHLMIVRVAFERRVQLSPAKLAVIRSFELRTEALAAIHLFNGAEESGLFKAYCPLTVGSEGQLALDFHYMINHAQFKLFDLSGRSAKRKGEQLPLAPPLVRVASLVEPLPLLILSDGASHDALTHDTAGLWPVLGACGGETPPSEVVVEDVREARAAPAFPQETWLSSAALATFHINLFGWCSLYEDYCSGIVSPDASACELLLARAAFELLRMRRGERPLLRSLQRQAYHFYRLDNFVKSTASTCYMHSGKSLVEHYKQEFHYTDTVLAAAEHHWLVKGVKRRQGNRAFLLPEPYLTRDDDLQIPNFCHLTSVTEPVFVQASHFLATFFELEHHGAAADVAKRLSVCMGAVLVRAELDLAPEAYIEELHALADRVFADWGTLPADFDLLATLLALPLGALGTASRQEHDNLAYVLNGIAAGDSLAQSDYDVLSPFLGKHRGTPVYTPFSLVELSLTAPASRQPSEVVLTELDLYCDAKSDYDQRDGQQFYFERNSERLEFLGDSVLKYLAALWAFFHYELGDEGVLSSSSDVLKANRSLQAAAVMTELRHSVRGRPFALSTGSVGAIYLSDLRRTPMSLKQQADVVEALIASVYLGNWRSCEDFPGLLDDLVSSGEIVRGRRRFDMVKGGAPLVHEFGSTVGGHNGHLLALCDVKGEDFEGEGWNHLTSLGSVSLDPFLPVPSSPYCGQLYGSPSGVFAAGAFLDAFVIYGQDRDSTPREPVESVTANPMHQESERIPLQELHTKPLCPILISIRHFSMKVIDGSHEPPDSIKSHRYWRHLSRLRQPPMSVRNAPKPVVTNEQIANMWYGEGYRPPRTTLAFYMRARIHRSLSGTDSYERLEFLGDSALSALLVEWLYSRFPGLSEGDLSRMKSLLQSNRYLACKVLRRLNEFNPSLSAWHVSHNGGVNADSLACGGGSVGRVSTPTGGVAAAYATDIA